MYFQGTASAKGAIYLYNINIFCFLHSSWWDNFCNLLASFKLYCRRVMVNPILCRNKTSVIIEKSTLLDIANTSFSMLFGAAESCSSTALAKLNILLFIILEKRSNDTHFKDILDLIQKRGSHCFIIHKTSTSLGGSSQNLSFLFVDLSTEIGKRVNHILLTCYSCKVAGSLVLIC